MVTALYRRYRPENFAEMIGQSQVTDPLMTALRTNRVNHAYLFSGPRGCGKTTSARILARCLNCAEGPTDKPCGVCPSCVELSRDGMGSLDVVEIDAASHGGVDDARDLRERAIFAPARDRYKIFIIDEAHMVTSGGFNALLKIVEEPPEHIKFIFATTEPDKVIGTIRSRTHHYPFRLIPPAQLLEYVQQLCETEGVEVAPGVLPLVVRAGGGSARDTLSLLDQLIAGSENNRVEYERAVALLGYTHGALLSEVIDAIGAHDGAAAFDAVDRVIQTGQDPRRFVEDLLERLRDIIIVAATRESASSVLRGVPAEEIEGMRRQAAMFGHAELSRVADIVNDALTEMTGATSPRLHLELMIARTLVPASDDTERGALVRVERLERRIGVDGPDAAVGAASAAAGRAPSVAETRGPASSGAAAGAAAASGVSGSAARPASGSSGSASSAQPVSSSSGSASAGQPASGSSVPASSAQSASGSSGSASSGSSGSSSSGSSGSSSSSPPAASAGSAADSPAEAPTAASAEAGRAGAPETGGSSPTPTASPSSDARPASPAAASTPVQAAAGEVSLQQLKDAWPEILEAVQKAKMTAWLVVFTAQVRALDGDVLTLAFPSENDVASFKERSAPGQGVSEYLRQAIVDVLGLRVKYIARVDSSLRPEAAAPDAGPSTPGAAADGGPSTPGAVADASAGAETGAGADGWALSAPSAEASPAPTWSTPGVSNPGSSVAPAPTVASSPNAAPATGGPTASGSAAAAPPSPAPKAAPAKGPAAAGSQSARGAARPQVDRGAAPAPTTSWDVVAIPTSSDEEPPPFDEPLPSDEPDLPPDRAEYGAGAPAPASSGLGGSSAPDGSGSASAAGGSSAPAGSASALAAGGSGAPEGSAPASATGGSGAPEGSASAPESTSGGAPAGGRDASATSGGAASGAVGTGSSAASGAVRTDSSAASRAAGSGSTGAGPSAGTRPSERAARPSGAPDPAARPGALRFEAAPDADADSGARPASAPTSAGPASASRASAPSRATTPPAATAGGRARYGEAVVREILGANFIEEQPLPGREG